MNIDELLEESLSVLAGPLPQGHSLAPRVLERIAAPERRAARSPLPWRRTLRARRLRRPIGAGLAAALVALAAAAWLLLAGAAPTIAEVDAALAQQHWVHLAFDDGSEQWICLDDGREFRKSHDGELYFRDTATKTEQRYFRHLDEINIMKPQAWVMGTMRNGRLIPVAAAELDFSDLDARKPRAADNEELAKHGVKFEFDEVTEEGRKLGRFRTSRRDAQGEMQIDKELWIDMATRLPVRVRTRLSVRDQQAVGREYRMAKYEFGPTGPRDLHDIGAPRTATIFQFRPRHEQLPLLTVDAQAALRGASAAILRFPPQFRVIELGGPVHLTYWSATRTQMDSIARSILGDSHAESPRLFRADNHDFGSMPDVIGELADADSAPDSPLPVNEIVRWFPICKAYNTLLYDGSRQFQMTQFGKSVELHILPGAVYREPPPLADGWQFTDWNYSEFQAPIDEEPAPAGQLLVHARRGPVKHNWYVDPAHDFTVARHVEQQRVKDRWKTTIDARAVAWRQTEGGSWYVSAWDVQEPILPQPGHEDDAPEFEISRRRIEITPLETKDLPPEVFNGEKLLERARKANAKIKSD